MEKDRIRYLLQQYAINSASREEVDEMFKLMRSVRNEDALKELIAKSWMQGEDDVHPGQEDSDRMWAVIQSVTSEKRERRVLSMTWMRAAAAVLLLLISGSIYWIFLKKKPVRVEPVAGSLYKNDIAPGTNKAILTLANGSTILLDSAHDGMVAQQGGTRVLKLDAGALAYNAENKKAGITGDKNTNEVAYNTIATPHGGQYMIVLPDGSKAWLNAASSLRFPTVFAGKERVVELKGEAYFEIAKNADMPFHVKVAGSRTGTHDMDVQVLGTGFNIMAYTNEQQISTTLLEGKVKVVQDGVAKTLEPGRQAIVDNQTYLMSEADANVEQTVAWKNGLFRFHETGIRELMRQVERWYDVEVVYKTDGSDQDYTGVVPRNQNLSTLLHTLELTGTIHFKIEGKKVIVLP